MLVLAAFKSLKSASSVPAGFTLDDVSNCCTAYTYLQSKKSDTLAKRLLDTLASVFLEFFVILIWHGLWSLLDGYDTSAKLSLLAGILSNVLVFILQFAYSYYVKTMPEKSVPGWYLAYMFGTLFSLLCIFSSVNTFRGYWYLLDEYFPEDVDHSKYYLIVHIHIVKKLLRMSHLKGNIHFHSHGRPMWGIRQF